jgi:RNA polymerase sigma factor (sigma-70 family)
VLFWVPVQVDPPKDNSDLRPEFLTTQWSQVLLIGTGSSTESREALEKLCRAYWSPLYAYARRDGLTPHAAQDLVQGFIAHLIERKDLTNVAPEKGRFRSFLLAALKNFLVSQVRSDRALKRGGGQMAFPLHDLDPEVHCAPELTDSFTPDKAFDRRWARTVMARALEALRAAHKSPSQARLFDALRPALMDNGRIAGQAALAAELGITPGALAVAATRMRQQYRQLIEHEVKQTLTNPSDFAAEMQALRDAWT